MLKQLLFVFLKLGITGFGGPAAHIAMMREEVVVRRKWISEQEFLDLIGAVNLIPGPNSTELAIHIGHRQAGWKGLLTAGVSFILPAFLCVLALAVFYEKYGSFPRFHSVLMGIRPVVTAIVMQALLSFRKTAVPDFVRVILAALALGISLQLNEVLALVIAGGLFVLWKKGRKFSFAPELFLIFLKIGSVLFGSGYVLLAFIESEFVTERGWLTKTQLLDAISVGQLTPGPVFTTATFVGYLIDGYSGSILATVGIFLPSFIFVALTAPLLPRLRSSMTLAHFLDGVIAGSFGLMLWVTIILAREAIPEWRTAVVGILSLLVLRVFPKVNSAWWIILGGSAGYIFF